MNPAELVPNLDYRTIEDQSLFFFTQKGDLFIFVKHLPDYEIVKMTGHDVRTRIPPIEEPEPENHHEAMRSLSSRVSGQLADMFEELNSSRHSEESEGFITAMLRIIDKAREEIDHRL